MLRVARRIGEVLPVSVATTFLGAHALPPEFAGRADDYIDEICERMLPRWRPKDWPTRSTPSASGSVFPTRRPSACSTRRASSACRSSCTPSSCRTSAARELVARFGGLSADHLEHLTQAGIDAMAAAGTVAVLLPGAYYFLRDTTPPPVAALRAAGVPMAVATDCNPGTSPMTSILLAMNMACTLWRLTPQEALAGVHAQRRARAGAAGRHRHAGSGQARRLRAVADRAAGRPVVRDRLQSMPRRSVQGRGAAPADNPFDMSQYQNV